ncbi:RNA-binding S4 domain-containing protein [Arenicella xantha]|uniref:Ribosome-associated heat shock protein Hsp15 n=1 Tax=Arenicella xantha TaxID=644221 RepID=A0A395JP95_9GAMM|nr:RNA-binding S4 domain-containing protein [Arenicella xantha]RBP53471.1 ribosome-associated heat shock protein Hsp15 [Arenicella xantha]
MPTKELESVRIDKWLWAARFFKTRQLSAKAIKSSQILSGKQTVKPASLVKVGDIITLKRGLYLLEVEVLGLSEQRGSATVAQTLYRETQASQLAREKLKQQLDSQPKIDIDRRKPDKRGVRSHRAIKRGGE